MVNYDFFLHTETVKDLIRFLKREDDTCDIRRELGESQIVQNDLIPIIKQYPEDKALFDTVIRFNIKPFSTKALLYYSINFYV